MVAVDRDYHYLKKIKVKVLDEIILHNNLFDRYFFLRSNANCVHSDTGEQFSEPHIDHRFSHYNMLIYLNDCDGETVVGDKIIEPEEDKVIVFEGEHYMRLPSSNRRVILIATLINYKGNV